jgi:endonuclease YncB( thermonuclease family)
LLILLALAGAMHMWQSSQRAPVVMGRAQIIDGDSLRVGGRELRLKGLDAPEGRQSCDRQGRSWRCGEAAADRLRELTAQQTVTCEIVEVDRFERGLALCRAADIDINAQMVADGFAVSFGAYQEQEASARAGRRGLWAGTFEQPQAWRRRNGVGQ